MQNQPSTTPHIISRPESRNRSISNVSNLKLDGVNLDSLDAKTKQTLSGLLAGVKNGSINQESLQNALNGQFGNSQVQNNNAQQLLPGQAVQMNGQQVFIVQNTPKSINSVSNAHNSALNSVINGNHTATVNNALTLNVQENNLQNSTPVQLLTSVTGVNGLKNGTVRTSQNLLNGTSVSISNHQTSHSRHNSGGQNFKIIQGGNPLTSPSLKGPPANYGNDGILTGLVLYG